MRYRCNARRKSSVETWSPRSHCCSSFERSSANTSASRLIAEGHQAIGFFDGLAWLVHECSLNFFPATAQSFQLMVWKQWRCGISAYTLLWLSDSLLKILLSRHPLTQNRSRTSRLCRGTMSFGEIGSCESPVVDFLGLVCSERYGHGYAPFLCASRSSSSS
jgi:hypothetical protein